MMTAVSNGSHQLTGKADVNNTAFFPPQSLQEAIVCLGPAPLAEGKIHPAGKLIYGIPQALAVTGLRSIAP